MWKPATENPKYAQKRRISVPYNLPAPTGGLNARDAFTAMSAQDAINLTNIFPEANYCAVRGGWAPWRSGQANPVRSLMTWNGSLNVDKIFAGAGSTIWDVTASGSSPTSQVTSLTNVDFQWTNLENNGGIYLCVVNGADSMRVFNGSAWSTPSITGVSSSTFANICQFKQRLWFNQTNSLNAYYLGIQAIAGPATLFPLGAVFRQGGTLVGMGTFSRDSGDGPNEYLCFITTKGEVAVYEGTDPTSATTFALVGVYTTGYPIGRRCTVRWNGDLGIITEDGLISMQSTLQYDRNADQRAAITAKIQTLFSQLVANYKSNFGWQTQLYAKQRYLIVNVPQIENQSQFQLVMNTVTGAWCQFQNMNAGCWGVANDQLYFGGDNGTVYLANTGNYDNQSSAIAWEMQTAWQLPGGDLQGVWQMQGGPTNKMFTAIRPTMLVGQGMTFAIDVDLDFQIQPPSPGNIKALSPPGSTMIWSWIWPAQWGGNNVLDERWQSVGGVGTWVSVHMLGQSQGPAQFNAFQLLAEPGGPY